MKHLSSSNQHTMEQIRRHPTTHNLEWRDIRKLFEEVGEAECEHNGNLKLIANGKTMIVQSMQDTKVASEEEIHEIRKLLMGADLNESQPSHSLLVVDHQSAKLYKTETSGSIPEKIIPYDPLGHRGHVHSKHQYEGYTPESNDLNYFLEIAKLLEGDEPIIVFGSGSGSSNTMGTFLTYLNKHHPKIAERITNTVEIDQSHLSDGEILQKARELFAVQA